MTAEGWWKASNGQWYAPGTTSPGGETCSPVAQVPVQRSEVPANENKSVDAQPMVEEVNPRSTSQATVTSPPPAASHPAAVCANGHWMEASASFCPACGMPKVGGPGVTATPAWNGVPAQYGQTQYGPGPFGHIPVQTYIARTTNGLAIASMILGILWLYWVGSILAVIFGHVALRQIQRRDQSGRGMAIAGLVLGWIGIGFFVVIFVVFLIVRARNN